MKVNQKYLRIIKNFKLKLILVLFLFIFNNNYAKSDNFINYEIMTYQYDELYSKVELNYYFLNKIINYNITYSDSISGSVTFVLNLKAKNVDLPMITEQWKYNSIVAKNEFKKEISLFGQRLLAVLPNIYDCSLSLINPVDSSLIYKNDFELVVPDFNDKFSISDIQIPYLIKNYKENENNYPDIFIKNNFYIFPNPTNEITSNTPILYLYYEIYNSKTLAPNGLKIDYIILDATKKEVERYSKTKASYSEAMVEILEMPLSGIATGIYYVQILIKSNDNDISLEKVSKFYLINPDLPPDINAQFSESLTFEESSFSSMDEEMVKLEFEKIYVILDEYEKEEYQLLTDNKARQRALFKYWLVRDTKQDTKVNEKRIEYDKRISFAETYFLQGMMPGWKTERGRTLLKYGFPTQRNLHPQRDNKAAAEEWFYAEIRGGVYFYFVDRLFNGNYVLAHSTMINEVYNPYWYQDYNPAIESDGSDRFKIDERFQQRR